MNAANVILIPEARASRYVTSSYEAFSLFGGSSRLLDPLEAGSLAEALAETTSRWAWDRGDRLAVREIGEGRDQLHVYAVRRKSAGTRVWDGYVSSVEHDRWLDHVCTIDLNVVAGIAHGAVGAEIQLHEHRQRRRPEGARLQRVGR